MQPIIHKFVIMILCSFLSIYSMDSFIPIWIYLITIAITCFITGFEQKLYKDCLFILYIILCVLNPLFLLFIPVMIYDLFYEKVFYYLPIYLLYLLLEFIYIHNLNLKFQDMALFLILSFASYLLQKSYAENLLLNEQMRKLRDDSTELTLLLERKNHDLMEKQDYEIHLATLKERNRIAREIHDNVGHLLTSSILQLAALKMILRNKQVDLSPYDSLQNTLDTAMTSIRASVHDLHDDTIHLQSAIEDLINGFPEYDITLDYDFGEAIPKSIKYSFLSILKESLNNIAKHSNATTATIILREHPGFYQLHIYDNGTNIHFSSDTGLGLSSIAERVKNLNGTLKITTDNGFRIQISVMKG